jgi:ribose transport system substrate-binding protein
MKQLLALGLSLALLFSLAGCQQAAAPAPEPAASSAPVATPAEVSATDVATPTDPADQSTDPADVSDLLAEGLDGSSSTSTGPEPVEEPEEITVERAPRTFGLSMPSNATLTQKATAKALKKRIEAMGDTLIVAEKAENADAQRSQLNSLAGQHVDAIFLCPTDAGALEETVDDLERQNMPVFGFGDWDYTPEGMVSVVRSDEYNAGYVCGMDLADRCPEGGDVVVLELNITDSMYERCQGFMDAAEESGVDLEIADELEVTGSRKSTAKAVKKALKEYPNLVGIFAASDRDAEGALRGVKGTSCLVYSGDGSPELKAQLGVNPNLGGLGAQSPLGMAKALVQSVNDHLDGEAVEDEEITGTFLITAKNVEKYGTDKWQ